MTDIPIKYKQYTYKEATETARKLRECRERFNISRDSLDTKCQSKIMPSSVNSIISYEQCVSPNKKRQNVTGMKLSTFYELCEYYKVSADYLLGFKESRHRETSADYIKSEFGIDDDELQHLKQMVSHDNLHISPKYNNFNEIDFFKLFITSFVKNFEIPIIEYFDKMDAFEEFKEKNIDSQTNLLKNYSLKLTKAEKKDKELVDEDASIETRLIDEYRDLEYAVQIARLDVIRNFENFLKDLKESLLK